MIEIQSDRLLLMSDLHIDHPNADLRLIKSHLAHAADSNAAIIIGGDLFDAMQTRNDPRRSYGGLREEHKQDDYLDAIIRSAIDLLKPYADYIVAITDGNHETAALRASMTHIVRRVCDALGCKHMPFRGWALWGEHTIYFAHGAGSTNSPVTMGVLDVARQRAWADADVIWNGHTHTAYVVPFIRMSRGERRLCWAIRTPSYLRFTLGSSWSDEKGHSPQPMGCALLERNSGAISVRLLLE